MDKAALRGAWGGPLAGTIAQHLIPDDLLEGRLKDFAPFKTAGDHGDLRRARAEMAKAKYATRNGVCVARACKRVFLTSNCNADLICGDIEYAASQRITGLLKPLTAKIGITLRPGAKGHWDLRSPGSPIPISQAGYWRDQYPDASNFVDPVFASWSILPGYNPNTSLVGITPAQAGRLGVEGRIRGVPSVDADIAGCGALAGPRRLACYAALDRKLSTEIVPWIPFLWRNRITILGPQVAKWEFDESSGTTSFAHVAVKR